MSPPNVDLVIAFRTTPPKSISKRHIREEVEKAKLQYAKLLETLSKGGLNAAGRRGEKQGHVMVFVSCPQNVITRLVRRERHADFLNGLPTASPCVTSELDTPLSPADRLRIIEAYVTSTPADGGLGILPGSLGWPYIESVMVLHDREFNALIRNWSTHQTGAIPLKTIREHFGVSIALYFSFLSSYTTALMFPAALGIIYHFFGTPYSPIYSALLLLWSVSFVEWWRIRERLISLRNGTRGSFLVERHRADYVPGFPWWTRDLRRAASLPIILLFVVILATLLTCTFVIEAFVTKLYTGPGRRYVSFAPTILVALFVPRFLSLYRSSAVRLTKWENHEHHSTYASSLTIKLFALSAVVSFLGLALSAFVYVPFGEDVMRVVQTLLFDESSPLWNSTIMARNNGTVAGKQDWRTGIWEKDTSSACRKLNPSRLQDEMFAYTVTNQIVGAFTEIGLPYVLRVFNSFWNRKRLGGRKKRVGFEDETNRSGEKEGKEEREFLETVRSELALTEYDIYNDYSEMVTQFGYVALWSTIWPLAPVMALLNNFLESRSDAFKLTVHHRRPIPTRTDTIGPWLDTLSFLTWLSALTNSALVYLFRPQVPSTSTEPRNQTRSIRELLLFALLVALASSHGYILLQRFVRHVVERALWRESEEVKEKRKGELEVKDAYFKSLGGDNGKFVVAGGEGGQGLGEEERMFWEYDEGMEEIKKLGKDE